MKKITALLVGKLSSYTLGVVALAVCLSGPVPVLASPILSSDLASFAVLGASTVTNTGATTLTGNLGVSPGTAITGQEYITINGQPALTTGSEFVHETDALAGQAQIDLTTTRTKLSLLGPGTLLGSDLTGLTILPGVYTVPAGTTNLAGTVTLDGQGDANAFWLFQMSSTLITSSNSTVEVVDAGSGAGLFWNVGSSATLGTGTSFYGNILADASITLNTDATIVCGRALASTGAVTLDHNTIDVCNANDGYSGTGLEFDSSGSVVEKNGTVIVTPVPEPSTFLLLSGGLVGLAFVIRRRREG
ncbi:MAG: ice-binding family protein [Desulfuromonas sp.]